MKELQKKIIMYLTTQPEASTATITTLARAINAKESETIDAVYILLRNFLSGGKSRAYEGEYYEDELEQGMQIELEHFSNNNDAEINQLLAEKISKDHLAEFNGKMYYTLLSAMEEILKEVVPE